MKEIIAQLQQQVAELLAWKEERVEQQLFYPVDDNSKSSILPLPGVPENQGDGETPLTQVYNVAGGMGGTVTAPRALLGTILLEIDGVYYEMGYVNKII